MWAVMGPCCPDHSYICVFKTAQDLKLYGKQLHKSGLWS